MNQIGIEQICNIGLNVTINPRNLTCSICFCINISAKECLNKKCQKLFCNTCYESLSDKKENNTKISKCPFCRITLDFTKADDSLINIINNLQFFCSGLKCVTKFSLGEYIPHFKNKEHSYSASHRPLIKCGNCMLYSTDENVNTRHIEKCFNCKISICTDCNEYFKKTKRGEILCGICTVICTSCNKDEAKVICNMCSSPKCINCSTFCEEESCRFFLCKDTSCYKAKVKDCSQCREVNINLFYNKCSHLVYFDCNLCYPKCKYEKNIKSNIKCKICLDQVCIKNCSLKCKSCKEVVCKSCAKFCAVCKVFNCINCLDKCDNCNTNLYFCNSCNIDLIRKCNAQSCIRKLCLSCWNVCNFCNVIFCQEHSINCINCEEQCCLLHNYNCKLCNKSKDDEKFKRLCLKKCTNQCSFCESISNYYCDKDKHNVKALNCGHKVCKNCLKGCAKCGNVVVNCPKCIVNYYFHLCKTCNVYLCSPCANFCSKCEDVYCSLPHKCIVCGKSNNKSQCLTCFLTSRTKCTECKVKLNNCEKCFNKYVCSVKCYLDMKDVCCEMFVCNKDRNLNITTINLVEKNFESNKVVKPERGTKMVHDKTSIGCLHSCILF